jgi:glyoxylase-like metal-dependent hydrolase (beta-lactamase superfamily II)
VSALVEGAALLAGIALEALALPGHSGDGLALVVPEAGLLLPGDYLSPCEIPFVEDLDAYRATLRRLIDVASRITQVIPGHGRMLTTDEARAIADEDLVYLDALSACAARGDRDGAERIVLPRATGVPGMREHHLDNVRAAFGETSR